MADIGYFVLVPALLALVYAATEFVLRLRRWQGLPAESGRKSLPIACGLTMLAVVLPLQTLPAPDFHTGLAASYSSRGMSVPHLLNTMGAGNNDRVLCWGWILSIFGAVVVLGRWRANRGPVSYSGWAMVDTEVILGAGMGHD